MAGLSLTGTQVQDRAGILVVSVWQALEDCRKFKLWLDDATHNDAFLNGINITGASGTAGSDVKLIRDSFADLAGTSGLWAVSHGTFAPSGASNYFANAKVLAGINYAG